MVQSLHRFKQLPWRWNKNNDECLTNDLQFCAVSSDPCLYARFSDKNILLLAHFVNDLLISRLSAESVSWIKEESKRHLEIKDVGEAGLCLCLEITCDSRSQKLFLSQTAYVPKILELF